MRRREPNPTATCCFCHRSRPLRFMERSGDYGYQCRDEVSCSEATQWSTGGDDDR